MDLRKALEKEHTKTLNLQIIEYVGSDRKRLKELVGFFFGNEPLLSQRAAWALGDIGINNPDLFKPFIPKLITKLKEPGLHPAIPRNILRMFQSADIEEKYQAELLDQCFSFILNESQTIAIRAFAITVATRIAASYPELQKELFIVLKDLSQLPQSPAITVRLKSALKELKRAVPSF